MKAWAGGLHEKTVILHAWLAIYKLYKEVTLSRLWTTYVVQQTEIFHKFAVHTVLELCARCRYQHMRIELLFHVVF